MWNRLGILPWYALLVTLVLTLFSSTIVLYVNSDVYRLHLSKTVRVSSWTIFQTQLEFVKLSGLLASCRSGGSCSGSELLVRAEILASRLDVLANSDEAAIVPYIDSYRADLNAALQRLIAVFGRHDQLVGGAADGPVRALADALHAELVKLQHLLQDMLRDSTIYNESIEQRENALRLSSPTIPFIMLGLSGLALVVMLFTQLKDRERTLRQVASLRAEELRQQEDTAALIDGLPTPVCVLDNADQIVFLNAAAKAAFNSVLDELGSKLAHLDADAQTTRVISLPVGEGQSRTYRCRLTRLTWSGRNASVFVLQDTAVEGNAQLAAMGIGKMVLLGELSSAIVHELNQPLTTITVAVRNLGAALKDLPPEAPAWSKLERIQGQVERISRIVTNVRKLSSPIEPIETFVLQAVVEAALQMTGYQFELNSIRVELRDRTSGDVRIRGNPFLMEICIVNLLLNARDAFVANMASPDARRVNLELTAGSGFATLEVMDNAGGIDPALMDRVFESFVTSKLREGGMGVGLAISRRAVQRMGGTIAAENRDGGACLTIRLPISSV